MGLQSTAPMFGAQLVVSFLAERFEPEFPGTVNQLFLASFRRLVVARIERVIGNKTKR
jgi:hypothetical protein